jgi:hypothetical protein
VYYCMLPLDEKYLSPLSLSLFFCIFWGSRETEWFEGRETREADISSFGTLPTLLVPKPYPITL